MQKEFHCKYCGINTTSGKSYICSECSKKLKLVRKLRKILSDIKEMANREEKK